MAVEGKDEKDGYHGVRLWFTFAGNKADSDRCWDRTHRDGFGLQAIRILLWVLGDNI